MKKIQKSFLLFVDSLVFRFEFHPKLSQTRETDPFYKILIIKFTLIHKNHLALVKIGVLVYLIIQELKFFKIAQLFLCFTFSGDK